MNPTIHDWLHTDRQPANVYELLGRPTLDPDRAGLRDAIQAALQDLLAYEGNPDREIRRRARRIERDLAEAAEALLWKDHFCEYEQRVLEGLCRESRKESTSEGDDSRPPLRLWLQQRSVHPAAIEQAMRAIVSAPSERRRRATALGTGELFAGCRIVSFDHSSGAQSAYLAEHVVLRIPVTLTLFHGPPGGRELWEEWLRNVWRLARVRHPGVLPIYDAGVERDLYYVVTERVEGKTLVELAKKHYHSLPWRSALRIVQSAAKATEAIHAEGLIHGDIRPASITLGKDSSVRLREPRVRSTYIRFEEGSCRHLFFRPPEQWKGQDLDLRSDVYSLGATLHYLLIGYSRFQEYDAALARAALAGTRMTLSYPKDDIPEGAVEVVERAMAVEPKARFRSAAEMAKTLKKVLRGELLGDREPWESAAPDAYPPAAAPAPAEMSLPDAPAERAPARRRTLAPLLAAAILIAVLLSMWALLHRRPKAPVAVTEPEGMMWIEPGGVQLGEDLARLRAFLEELPGAMDREQALEMIDPEERGTAQVAGFWIDRYEVTNAQYAVFRKETARGPPPHWPDEGPPPGEEEHPVTNITYEEAEAYARWAGKALPTREQWVRAFRSDSDMLFPWGNPYQPAWANVRDNFERDGSSPVADTPRDISGYGVCNLAGNVSEFIRNPEKQGENPGCVVKGGNYASDGFLRGLAISEFTLGHDARDPTVGFRCVIEETPDESD